MLLTIFAMAAQIAVTFGIVEQLPSSSAGDVVLAGRQHGTVEQVVMRSPRGLEPPGVFDVDMIERPLKGADGCSRTVWKISFQHVPETPREKAIVSGIASSTQIALSGPDACPSDSYAKLDAETNSGDGYAALRLLDKLRAGKKDFQISCTDETMSLLCRNKKDIGARLAKDSPWMIMRRGEIMTMWLGVPGSIITEISYSVTTPYRVTVVRRIPYPA